MTGLVNPTEHAPGTMLLGPDGDVLVRHQGFTKGRLIRLDADGLPVGPGVEFGAGHMTTRPYGEQPAPSPCVPLTAGLKRYSGTLTLTFGPRLTDVIWRRAGATGQPMLLTPRSL